MLDESMFEDIHEIAENSAYLRAVEEKDVSLEMYEQLPAYEQCREIEDKLRADNRLTFECIFNEPTGFYCIKTFLTADYAVDKAIFIKDVEAYKSMRFESARRKVAALLYQRFVSTDPEHDFKHGLSVFQIIQQSKGAEEKKERDGKVQPASINLSASPSHAQSLELKTVIPPASPLNSSAATTVSNGHTALTAPTPTGSTLSLQPATVNGYPVSASALSAAPPGSLQVSSPPHLHTLQHSPITPSSPSHAAHTLLQMGSNNNPIGVYGKSVRLVREKVNRGEAPKDLFDEVARDVMTDLKLDAFPRFKHSDFYRRYIRTKAIETHKVQVKDFTTFRVLGRGGFGAVHACRKKNSGQIYAMKCINKKLVKVKSALDNVLEERNVLTMMKSHFVTNLKYGLQDDDTLYLIMDLMLGGDLKFHLINAGRFTEKRARFYAAQVLLGLEHVHKLSIIYRDMKLENVLLDHAGHCKLSDLGLAVVTKVKIKGYAGTPGYCFTAADHELLTGRGFMNLSEVEAHFRSHAELDVACWVDGRQEFHPITADKLTVAEDTLDLVTFSNEAHGVSLRVTAGHRMYGRLGAVSEETDGSLSWADDVVPDRRSATAREVVASGSGSSALSSFQVLTAFPLGSAATVDVWQLPFVDALGLHTDEHIAAFLWLYGYWLSDGWLDAANARIAFGSVKPQHCDALDAALARLPLPQLASNERGELGYCRATELTKEGRRYYFITAAAWWQYFGQQYGPDAEGFSSSSGSAKCYWYWVWRLSAQHLRMVLAGQRFAGAPQAEQTVQTVHDGALYTASVQQRDEMVRLCLAAGYTASYSMDKLAGSWCVRYTECAQHVEPQLLVARDAALEECVATKVWCVTVPAKDNLIMVRRVVERDGAGRPAVVSRPVVIGNTAPEMIKNKLYGPAADIFSYGVMLYRMLCGSKPFKGKVDRDLDKAVIERKPTFPKEIFSKEAISLLTGLLQKRPENRLGCGERGIEEIKEHPFFESIDWGLLEAGYIDPPFVPNKFDVNAASLKDIGDFDRAKYKHVKLDDRFKQRIKNFEYVNVRALQDEMVQVLEKADENVNFEKFAQQPQHQQPPPQHSGANCCTIA